MNFDRPHRRLNILTGQWVLVSPHRAKRPWQGQVEKKASEDLPHYDPTCYLCPDNTRSTGNKNPDYKGTFAFDNDFASLLPPDNAESNGINAKVFVAEPENGECRVVCFSPRHDLTLPELSIPEITAVLQTWSDETEQLSNKEFIHYVQVFENKGAVMGCSNPHPHSQIWATDHIPNEPLVELYQQEKYLHENGSCLLCDYLKAEQESGQRIVAANQYFTALVPYWAIWPFEIMIIANRHCDRLPGLPENELAGLADVMKQVTIRYDNLFEISFPYSMGFHQSPFDGNEYPGWHLHAHYYPPLLRSATVRKFMVGFEMMAMPQRDLTPETAAEKLRALSPVHYKSR